MVPPQYVFVRLFCYFVEHWGCMSTEGTLNVCHVFTGEKYLGVIKLQVICGGLSVIVCHVAEIHLFSSRYTSR